MLKTWCQSVAVGQEAPGTNKRLREDLYKQFMSAEGISGRKPYGLRTRMIECRGCSSRRAKTPRQWRRDRARGR